MKKDKKLTNLEIMQIYSAYEKEWEYRYGSFWNIYFKILFMGVTINLSLNFELCKCHRLTNFSNNRIVIIALKM